MASPINVPLNAQLQNTQQLTQQIQAALNAARLNLGGGSRALNALSQPLGRLTGQADEFSKSLDAANARVLAFGASVGIVNAFANAFKNLVASTIEVEKAIKAITVVGDQFNNKTKELSQGLFNVAKTTGQSFAEVSKAALEFSRQGLGVEETLSRTQNALILTRLTGLDAAKAVEGLTAAANGFSKAGLNTTQILNKLAAVDQAFAVSSADLIEGFNRSAAVAQNAGVTFDELAGIITALQQETSRGGAVIGNALKTIFTRLQDTSTLNQLQNLGVAVQDLEGNLLPARQILQNLAKDVEGLGQITRAGIFKDVAGTFQINQLISLVSDLNKENSVAAAATRKAAGATNEAFAANEKLNQSLDAIINKVALTGKQLGALLGEIGLSDNLKGILDGINSFLEGATNLLQGEDLGGKFAKGIVKGIGSVLAGPGLGVFLAVIAKLTIDLVKFGAQSAKTFFGIGKAAKEQQLVQEAIVQTLLRNQSVLNRILSAQGGQNAQAQAFLSILNQQEQALQNIRTLAGGIAAPLIGAGYGIGPQGGLQRRGRAAGGYLPAQEAADVRRGVGGASPSSKVVEIPNFAFGGGKRGTMIANTSEYIVPNYAGGGSAIFNQDMVKTMGLPPGAKKIGAAGGFIPNFAREIIDVSGEYALITNQILTNPKDVLANPKNDPNISYKVKQYGIPPSTSLKGKVPKQFQDSRFTNEQLIEKYKKAAIKEATAYSLAIGGKSLGPYEIAQLSNPGVVAGLVGAIFESGISGVIQGEGLRKAQAEQVSNARFDFVNQKDINKFFGISESVPYVEAKYTASPDALKSLGNKIYAIKSSGFSTGRELSELDKQRIAKLGYADQARQLFGITKLPTKKIDIQDLKGRISRALGSASTGYIPNFAASALQQAIAREKSAGLSSSQIYVDQSSALKSPSNPMGLMVANTRDEPAGGFQGIARARKEGMNPKTYGAARGFVPNFFAPGPWSQAPSTSPTTSPANVPSGNTGNNPPPEVAKGFADMAGKIFLVQSALSFLNGAIGDSENSFAKLTAQVTTSVGNIASLGLLGQQIASANPAGALGKFAKGLGIAGIAVAGAAEAINLFDFAVKELSGENKKAALASAKLADASDKLSLKFESLSQTRQTELTNRASEILGDAGFKSFLGSIIGSTKAGGAIGGDVEIQKASARLLALGASEQDLRETINKGRQYAEFNKSGESVELGNRQTETSFEITQPRDIKKALEEALSSGIGKTLDTKFKSFETALAGIDLTQAGGIAAAGRAGAKVYGQKRFSDLNPQQQKLINDRIKQQTDLNKQKQEEQQAQNAINFGERLSLELAKKQVDSVLEIAKLRTQGVTSREQEIQLELQTRDLSNEQKINLETELKLLELQKKARADIVDSISSAVDKAQGAEISVDVAKLNDLKTFLNKLDFTKDLGANEFNKLAAELEKTYGIGEAQAKNLVKSIQEEQKVRQDVNAVTVEMINADRERALAINSVNQSLETQLSTIQRIAQTAQSISDLNISFGNLDIAKNEAEITRLQALASDPTLTAGQKEDYDKQVISLQKRNNELKKGNELRSFESKQSDILRQIQEKRLELDRISGSDQESLNKRANLQNDIDNLNRSLAVELNNYNASTLAIDANTQALAIQEQQIGKLVGAYASLNQQLESFRRGAGERIAGAELGILSSTDPTSLARSTIQRQVEFQAQGRNLNNQDYYKFINQETALREKQFELQVETSNVRKVELERELELMQQISAISASTDEERLAKIQEILAARQQELQSFGAGFSTGLATLQDKTQNFKSEIGQQIPELFASNLAQGLNDALSGAKSLKDALQDAAVSFLNAISQASLQNLANNIVVGLGGIGKASGGLIKGGSGVKDDIPAMLMGGEYVIKKSAVKKYGSSFLDALNNGKIRGYANGGGVQSGAGGFYVPGDYGEGSIRGKSQLLAFAGQSFTSGQYDRMGGFGLGGASVNLEAESARLTTFGRENSPLFERVQGAKEEAFKVYLDQLNQEKQYRDQLKQIEQAQKQREKQLISSLVQAAASVALNVVGGAATTGFRNAAGLAKVQDYGIGGQFAAGLGGIFKGGAGYGGLNKLFTGNFKAASTPIPFNRAAGGMIYGGSGVRDDVPAMLTGGEFVLNNRATRKLGVQNLSRLNSGEIGGEDRSGAVTEALLVKLDELIQATRETSSENVVVNVSTTNTGEVNENGGGNERDLQRKIRAAVLEVIAQEKRLGGSLNNRNR